jgi:hypothetical protein
MRAAFGAEVDDVRDRGVSVDIERSPDGLEDVVQYAADYVGRAELPPDAVLVILAVHADGMDAGRAEDPGRGAEKPFPASDGCAACVAELIRKCIG